MRSPRPFADGGAARFAQRVGRGSEHAEQAPRGGRDQALRAIAKVTIEILRELPGLEGEREVAIVGRDEARHFAFCNYLAQDTWGGLREDERTSLTKNIKAAYVYISVVFGEPRAPFWKVPGYFSDTHEEMQNLARKAGLGIIPQKERDEIWRKAMLRVKSVTDRFDVEFPAIPELGIDGTEVALTQEDLVVVSF